MVSPWWYMVLSVVTVAPPAGCNFCVINVSVRPTTSFQAVHAFDAVGVWTNNEQRSGRRRSREEANQLAAECEASGLSQREFCEQRGVPLKTLVRYLARYRREQTGENQKPQWVAVEVAAKRGDAGELSIVLAGGRRIEVRRGFDAETLRRLVAALERT